MTCSDERISPLERTTNWTVLLVLSILTVYGIFWMQKLHQDSYNVLWLVIVASSITALATGFGAVPFLFGRCPQNKWVGIGNAVAAGLMLGASISLLKEGWNIEGVTSAPLRLGVGAGVGVLLVLIAHKFLSGKEELTSPEAMKGADMKRMILVVGVMTVHSFAEGMGVGVSYGDGNGFGDFIALSIAIHNIPEGLAICLILIPEGTTVWRAALWSVFSSIPQPLVAVPAYLFVLWFRPLLPAGLGLAAGAMIWMVFFELLPEAKESLRSTTTWLFLLLGTAAMLGFQYLVG